MGDQRCPWCRGAAEERGSLPAIYEAEVLRCPCGAVNILTATVGDLTEAACSWFGIALNETDLGRNGIQSNFQGGSGWFRRPSVVDLERRLMDYLRGIERGEILLTCREEPQQVYSGHVSYAGSDGSRLVLFNDCNQWDYIEELTLPDGRTLAFGELDQLPFVRSYAPDDETAWLRYGIPGYLKHLDEAWIETRGVLKLGEVRACADRVEVRDDAAGFRRLKLQGSPSPDEVKQAFSTGRESRKSLLVDMTGLIALTEAVLSAVLDGTAAGSGPRVALVVTPTQRAVLENFVPGRNGVFSREREAAAWLAGR